MVTFETEFAQGGLDIVHAKIFDPVPKPVIVVDGDKEFVIVPEPEIRVQAPDPVNGLLADIDTPVDTQTV